MLSWQPHLAYLHAGEESSRGTGRPWASSNCGGAVVWSSVRHCFCAQESSGQAGVRRVASAAKRLGARQAQGLRDGSTWALLLKVPQR